MPDCIKKLWLAGIILLTLCLTACTDGKTADRYNKKIVTTTFAAYDWTKNVVMDAEGYDIIYLTKSGVDLHSFTPTTRDIANIATADLVIYIGGPSDRWVEDAVKNKVNPKQEVICLMDLLKNRVVEEELVEGMTGEDEEEEGIEYDEHVWMSLDNAAVITAEISERLLIIDGDREASWAQNADTYIKKLSQLETEYEEKIAAAPLDTVVVCDRFPFRYLFDEFKLKYYAAFPGCSAESEAGFDTVVFLSNKIAELGLSYVCVLENSPGDISKVVLENSGSKKAEVLTLNSLQSISEDDILKGADYVDIMEENLKTLLKLIGE